MLNDKPQKYTEMNLSDYSIFLGGHSKPKDIT